MRIYLDSCSLQRPWDDQTQLRIRVETEAVIAILAAVRHGDVVLMSSEALEYEIERIPDELRRTEVKAVLALAQEYLHVTDEAESLALVLEGKGISPIDAVHLALAASAKVDFFATCDDSILRKAKEISDLESKVVSVLGLVPEALT